MRYELWVQDKEGWRSWLVQGVSKSDLESLGRYVLSLHLDLIAFEVRDRNGEVN